MRRPRPWEANEFSPEHDADGDMIPDCRDLCPNDKQQDNAPSCDHGGDFDCDGICDGVDDCPLAADVDQANSNTNSEDKWNAGPMGDACEPVPVPAADPGPFTVAKSVTITSDFFTAHWEVDIQNKIELHPEKSRRARLQTTGAAEFVAPHVSTDFRFCQTDPDLSACTAAENIDDAQLHLEVPGASDRRLGAVRVDNTGTGGALRAGMAESIRPDRRAGGPALARKAAKAALG